MSDKILPYHLDRKAVLYVRQSSPFQVANNTEGQALQYAMRDRPRALGWSEVEVIDEDLGRSAAGCDRRAGFERMVAEVCLGRVGRSPPWRCRGSPATATTGSGWSRCVGSSIPC